MFAVFSTSVDKFVINKLEEFQRQLSCIIQILLISFAFRSLNEAITCDYAGITVAVVEK